MRVKGIVAVALVTAMLAGPVSEAYIPGSPVTVEAAKKTVKKTATKTTAKTTIKVASALSVFCGKQVSLAVDGAVKYTSSNRKVATVSSKGMITGKKAGKATITVKTKKKTYRTKVTVKKTAATITLAESAFKLTVGEKKKVNAVSPVKVSYKANNKNIRVDSKGNVTALKKGTSYITVSGKASGSYSAPKAVKVKVTVADPVIDLQYKGTASVTAGGNAKYKTASRSIATVDSKGKITAVKPGKTVVTVTAGKTTKKYNIVVTKAQSTIQVLSAVANITVGETENLNASSEVSVQYTSSNPDVITVDSKGNMTAKHAGTATIQLTGNENTYYFAPAAVNVQVTVPEPETVAQKALTMYNGAKTPQAFLEVCHNVASTIVSDGNWIYSKNNNKNTFVDSRNAARRNTDCAHYVSMCMQQFGTLPQGYRFHSDKATNQISYHPNNAKGKQVIEQAFAKYYNVLKYNGVPANQLDLKPGDICCYSGHVNVYAGKNSAGKSMWYDFAPGGTSDGKEESGYFTRVVKTGEMRMKVYTVLRLK